MERWIISNPIKIYINGCQRFYVKQNRCTLLRQTQKFLWKQRILTFVSIVWLGESCQLD